MLVPDPLVPVANVWRSSTGASPVGDRQRAGVAEHHVVIFTPIICLPEQCRGATEVCPKTDVYALVILFEMLAGRPRLWPRRRFSFRMHLFLRPPSRAAPAWQGGVARGCAAGQNQTSPHRWPELGIALDEQLRALRRTESQPANSPRADPPDLTAATRHRSFGRCNWQHWLSASRFLEPVRTSRAAATLVTARRSQTRTARATWARCGQPVRRLSKSSPCIRRLSLWRRRRFPARSRPPPEPPAPADPQAALNQPPAGKVSQSTALGPAGIRCLPYRRKRPRAPVCRMCPMAMVGAALHRRVACFCTKKYAERLVEARNAIGAGRLAAGWVSSADRLHPVATWHGPGKYRQIAPHPWRLGTGGPIDGPSQNGLKTGLALLLGGKE